MGKGLVFLVGLIAGAVVAHLVSRTPAGGRAFAAVNGVADQFTGALTDSYRARMAEGR